MPEADEEAPRDMMDVRPDESTLPTAGSRIWGNCTGVRFGIGIEVIGCSNKRSPTNNAVNQSVNSDLVFQFHDINIACLGLCTLRSEIGTLAWF